MKEIVKSPVTALCAELKPNFVLRTARSAVLNTKFVPDALAKCCTYQGVLAGVGVGVWSTMVGVGKGVIAGSGVI